MTQTTNERLDQIAESIHDIREPGYKRGYNNGLEEAAKLVDTIGYAGGLKNWQGAQAIRDMKVKV